MRTRIDALATERSLAFLDVNAANPLTEHVLERGAELPAITNVCAKVSTQLSQEIDHYCNLLNLSKRKFLEAAMIDALERMKTIASEEGVFDYLDRLSEQEAK
jgi:hypothetical protein